MKNCMMALLVLLLSSPAWGANVVTADVTNQAKQKPWHILLDMNHQPAMRDDQFTFTNFTAFFDYQWDRNNVFRILQAPTKFYDVGEGQNEWAASDTILSHFWNTQKTIGPARLRWITALNIPTALESQDNRKITTVSGTLQANAFYAGRFLVSLRPFVRYNWYEFKTSVSGTPLPAWVYGLNAVMSYQATDRFSLNLAAGYNIVINNASQFENTSTGFNTGQSEGRYFAQASANYEWTNKFSTYLSFVQGDNYIRDGRYELYAYDPVISRLGFGTTLYF